MDESTVVDRLTQLGMSEKEVNTYLSILRQGDGSASEIADAADVSKRYVYNVSERLEERGFVDVDKSASPTTIRARKPEEAIGVLTDELEAVTPALSEWYTTTEDEYRPFDVFKSRITVLRRMADLIATADSEITLSIPARHLPQFVDELEAAVDRGVLTLLLVSDAGTTSFDSDLDGVATVARSWDHVAPMILTVDQQYGVIAPVGMNSRSNRDKRAITFSQPDIAPILVGSLLANYWPVSEEVCTHTPRQLPATYDNFRHAVVDSTLHLHADRTVAADLSVTPLRDAPHRETIQGTITETRQGIVEPFTSSFPVECSLVVDTGSSKLPVGGPGTFLEDYEASSVTLAER
ncbi:TrmB family transcriptional regulator sugar-binding domain-containing protein [Halomicrobium urmianum]|uniref:TrmB family transcriptional regulator sugar-binding domain-containing protein n=1 Tax=Halomicrobium urmianum TaxID=1586233 RepID=UPI001CD930A8|nr:TrmB family transcriptional regulator sugar-binding domain-containing protein [Halomicrobium urmianum]